MGKNVDRNDKVSRTLMLADTQILFSLIYLDFSPEYIVSSRFDYLFDWFYLRNPISLLGYIF